MTLAITMCLLSLWRKLFYSLDFSQTGAWICFKFGCYLGEPLSSLLKAGCFLHGNIGNSVLILINSKSSSTKQLTRNHSYLVWGVPVCSKLVFMTYYHQIKLMREREREREREKIDPIVTTYIVIYFNNMTIVQHVKNS